MKYPRPSKISRQSELVPASGHLCSIEKNPIQFIIDSGFVSGFSGFGAISTVGDMVPGNQIKRETPWRPRRNGLQTTFHSGVFLPVPFLSTNDAGLQQNSS